MWHWARSIPPRAPTHAHPLAGFPRPLHCSRQEPLLAAQLGLGVEQGTGQGVFVPTSPSPAPSPAFGPLGGVAADKGAFPGTDLSLLGSAGL